jgi:ABC-type antimicrobial peptide transport system permease subunit
MLLKHDPGLVVNLASTMESHLQASMFLSRLAASLFGLCGGMGLLIASIGVYGVISFAVARRAQEIGIRMALGARPSQVVTMVLWYGAAVALVGIVIGVVGGLALARAARSLIYGVSASDPVTFISVPLVLIVVALLATAIPARRAARLDPNRTLRTE